MSCHYRHYYLYIFVYILRFSPFKIRFLVAAILSHIRVTAGLIWIGYPKKGFFRIYCMIRICFWNYYYSTSYEYTWVKLQEELICRQTATSVVDSWNAASSSAYTQLILDNMIKVLWASYKTIILLCWLVDLETKRPKFAIWKQEIMDLLVRLLAWGILYCKFLKPLDITSFGETHIIFQLGSKTMDSGVWFSPGRTSTSVIRDVEYSLKGIFQPFELGGETKAVSETIDR